MLSPIKWRLITQADELSSCAPFAALLACGGHDGLLTVRDPLNPDAEPMQVNVGSEVNDVAFGPYGDSVAVALADFTVWTYSVSDTELEKEQMLKRFKSPALALAWNHNGSSLATGDESGNVALINTATGQTVHQWQAHEAPIRSVRMQREQLLLATTALDGHVHVWSLQDKARVAQLQRVLPQPTSPLLADCSWRLRAAWSPDGAWLAVPGGDGKVHVVAQGHWDAPAYRLEEDHHEEPVSLLAWSPDGAYLASVSNSKVLVWSIASRQVLFNESCPAPSCDIAWSGDGEHLYLMNMTGKLGVWKNVVAALKKPTQSNDGDVPSAADVAMIDDSGVGKPTAVASLTVNDTPTATTTTDTVPAEHVPSARDGMGAMEVDADGAYDSRDAPSAPVSHTPLSRETLLELLPELQRQQHEPQAAFQPGASPIGLSRRFLAWNMIGTVVSVNDGLRSVVEVEFADRTAYSSIRVTDHFEFAMASLSTTGVVFAGTGDSLGEARDYVHYRPVGAGHGTRVGTQWSTVLPNGESAVCVAAGFCWAAVASSQRYVRVFTGAGNERTLFSVPGDVVCMVGHKDALAIVYHDGAPVAPGDQRLALWVLDVHARHTWVRQALPLTPGSQLRWMAWAEDVPMLVTMDTAAVVRGLAQGWDMAWVPLLDAKQIPESHWKDTSDKANDTGTAAERFWPIGLADDALTMVLLTADQVKEGPPTQPRPIVCATPLCVPILDAKVNRTQEKLLRHDVFFTQLEAQRITDATLRSTAAAERTKLDVELIRLLVALVQEDKPEKALDLFKMLSLDRSREVALHWARKEDFNAVADRMEALRDAGEQQDGDDDDESSSSSSSSDEDDEDGDSSSDATSELEASNVASSPTSSPKRRKPMRDAPSQTKKLARGSSNPFAKSSAEVSRTGSRSGEDLFSSINRLKSSTSSLPGIKG